MQAQETRGWVDRNLFPGGTRNLNLSQALDPFPSLPLLSEFLWNASPSVQIKHSSTLTPLPLSQQFRTRFSRSDSKDLWPQFGEFIMLL